MCDLAVLAPKVERGDARAGGALSLRNGRRGTGAGAMVAWPPRWFCVFWPTHEWLERERVGRRSSTAATQRASARARSAEAAACARVWLAWCLQVLQQVERLRGDVAAEEAKRAKWQRENQLRR
jgi:hypothetical protein